MLIQIKKLQLMISILIFKSWYISLQLNSPYLGNVGSLKHSKNLQASTELKARSSYKQVKHDPLL